MAAPCRPKRWRRAGCWSSSPINRKPARFPDLAKYRQGNAIVSATGQLAWNTDGKGFFTVNTPGTKAVVGFAEGKPQQLGDVTIELQCPYASLFVTAAEPGATLATARSALICAVARNCNSGFKYFAVDGKTLDNGKGADSPRTGESRRHIRRPARWLR